MKGKKRSLIRKYFTDEIFLELTKITMISDCDNNSKNRLIKELLLKYNIPFSSLGPGTNRMALQIDGYAVKFALDKDGKIDNRREMKYTKALQDDVIKVYECTPDGLIAVTEYVEIFTLDDFYMYKDDMREILQRISDAGFLIGDVGITSKNYVNWGKRNDGSICILDFAYIYSVSYLTFKCSCEYEALLSYDDNFVNLCCPACGAKYEFKDMRRRITKKEQEEEIGDIREIGYNLHCGEEYVDIVPEFEPIKENKNKKKENPVKIEIKNYLKNKKENRVDNNYYW